jgi:hypothetical protein
MSTRRAEDVATRLREAIVGLFPARTRPRPNYSCRGRRSNNAAEIFASCEVLVSERADGDGAYLHVRAERAAVERLSGEFGKV